MDVVLGVVVMDWVVCLVLVDLVVFGIVID